jgi:hypothetical protein
MSIYKLETILPEFVRFDNIKNKRKLRSLFAGIVNEGI